MNKFIVWLYRLYAKRQYDYFQKALENPTKHQEELRKQLDVEKHSPKTFEEIQDNIFIKDNIVAYELTSGSGGKTKRIPYTKRLLKSFENMFLIWSFDILENLSFSTYKMYFSISPQFIENEDGLKDDSEYLSNFTGWLSNRFFVNLAGAKEMKDSENFKSSLCQMFISNPGIEILSVWSPSFLIEIIDYAQTKLKANTNDLFPNIKFISCWGHGNAQKDYERLTKMFPNTIVQKKGLLATEAPLTLPLIETSKQVPLITEIYFEFLDRKENLLTLNEVQVGETYELVISQKAGLVRYRLKDLVKITGVFKSTPCFEFVARSDKLCDLVGEKLHEKDVFYALRNSEVEFIVPDEENRRYLILSEDPVERESLNQIDSRLRNNIHYHNSRELGQLKPLSTMQVPQVKIKLSQFFENELNIKRGDQKIGPLLYQKPYQLISFLKSSSSSP